MGGVKISHLRALVLAALIVAPTAALAQSQPNKLSSTARISITIMGTARVGVRSGARGGGDAVVVTDASGAPLAASVVHYSVRDSRGERDVPSLDRLEDALRASALAGEREVDVTLAF